MRQRPFIFLLLIVFIFMPIYPCSVYGGKSSKPANDAGSSTPTESKPAPSKDEKQEASKPDKREKVETGDHNNTASQPAPKQEDKKQPADTATGQS
jgi:hypothetical protein